MTHHQRLQNAAEQEVASIRVSMAGKAGELKLATTAKHIAEAQVEDLQRRVLDLQRLRAAAVKLTSHSSGSDPASPQVSCYPFEIREGRHALYCWRRLSLV